MKKNVSIEDYDSNIAEDFRRVQSNYRKSILVSLQSYQYSTLPDFVFQVIENDKTVFWLLRVHPRCAKKDLDTMISKLKEKNLDNCEIDFATKLPLKYLMHYINLHITRFSSVAIDAAMFDIPTIFIDEMAVDLYSRDYSILWNSGIIAVALDKQALHQAMQNVWNNTIINKLSNYFGNEDYQKCIHRMLK